MTTRRSDAINRRGRLPRVALPLAVVFATLAPGARAAPFTLLYSGTFNGSESLTRASATSPSFFTGTTLVGLALGPYMTGFVSRATGDLRTGILTLLVVAPVSLACLLFAWRRLPMAEVTLVERARAAGEPV